MLTLNLLGLVVLLSGQYSYSSSTGEVEVSLDSTSVVISSVTDYVPFSVYHYYDSDFSRKVSEMISQGVDGIYVTPTISFDTSFTYVGDNDANYNLTFGTYSLTFDYVNHSLVTNLSCFYDNSDTSDTKSY